MSKIILPTALGFGLIFALFVGAGYANYKIQTTPEAQERRLQEDCRSYKRILTENRWLYAGAFISETEAKYSQKGCKDR